MLQLYRTRTLRTSIPSKQNIIYPETDGLSIPSVFLLIQLTFTFHIKIFRI